VSNALQKDKDFVTNEVFLIDSLVFINMRLLLPFMINKTEYSDPVIRKKYSAQRMTRGLRDLISMTSSPLNVLDKNYTKYFTTKMDKHNA
jgi:hypothetical protein